MYSCLDPSVLYSDTSSDITENDVNVISDLWNMDGREVYRGSRDPSYTHANVYWLYDEDLTRVGLCEHALDDHANVRCLWFRDSEFATLLQEDGWTVGSDIWSTLPRHVYEQFFQEGWTSMESLREHTVRGKLRVITPDMLIKMPPVYSCNTCKKVSCRPFTCGTARPLDLPHIEKVVFLDNDFLIHTPPTGSRVYTLLGLTLTQQPHGDGSSLPQAQPEQAPEPEPQTASPSAP